MAVITISREAGSGGEEIARLVAANLNHHFVDSGVIRSLLQAYSVYDFDEVYDAAPGLSARLVARRGLVTDMLNRILRAVAHHGNAIILGRGGYAALRDVGDVLNVRVQAPPDVRARRMLDRGHARTIEAAQELARENDRRRATFVKLSYGLEWDSTHAFDLVIDTAKLSVEVASELLVRSALSVWVPDARMRLANEVDVDPVLANAVSDALACKTSHWSPASEGASLQAPP